MGVRERVIRATAKQSEPFDVDCGSGAPILARNSSLPDPLSFDERFIVYFYDVDLFVQMRFNRA